MPRGIKKQVNYQEEITRIESLIEKWTLKLEAFNARLKELSELKKNQDIMSLYDLLQSKDVTVETIVELLEMKKVS